MKENSSMIRYICRCLKFHIFLLLCIDDDILMLQERLIATLHKLKEGNDHHFSDATNVSPGMTPHCYT
jgi:hypothetical protein